MPDDAPLPSVPGRLDRAAVERVLARAGELQVGSGGPGDEAEELSESQILELGREVGLSPEHIRQALAEERTRLPTAAAERGMARRLVGPARVTARRMVAGDTATAIGAIDAWMQREECLEVKRHFPDRVVWEPQRGPIAALRRGLSFGKRFALTHATEVAATAVPAGDGRVLVVLDADFVAQRSRIAAQGVAFGGFGAISTTVLITLGFATAPALIPVVLAGTVAYTAVREIHGQLMTRAQLALEQLLDRLERGELARPSLLGLLSAAAGTLPRRP